MTQKCVICNIRPARPDKGYCANCEARIKARESTATKHENTVVKYLVYRGNVVGLVPSGNGTFKATAVTINPDRLPKDKTINLDRYCEGFDRSQIRKFKAAIALVYAV